MSTIGWKRLNHNVVVTNENPPVTIDLIEHYEPLKIEKDASDGQKEFVRRYNNMRKKLLESGLMQEK
jgi:hypothetical protein